MDFENIGGMIKSFNITQYLPIIIIALIGVAVVILALVAKRKAKDQPVQQKRRGPSIGEKYAAFAARNPLTRKAYLKVREKVALLQPADKKTVERETGNILLPATLGFLAGIAWPIVMLLWVGGFDLFYGLSGILAALVLYKTMTTGKLRKMRKKLLIQLQESFGRIRHYYHQTGRVDDAVNMAARDAGEVARPHLDDIYRILCDPECMAKTDEYAAGNNEKHVLMLLTICASVKEYGDQQTKEGLSVFLTSLGYLKDDIDMEILTSAKRDRAFSGVLGLVLAPLLAIKPLEKWATSNMPAISKYYEGMYATVTMVIMFALTYLVYSIVDMLMDDDRNKQRGDSLMSRVAAMEPLSSILNGVVRRNYTKYLRINSRLRATGDHTGVKAFLAARVVYAVIGFVVAISVSIFGTYVGKSGILKDFAGEYASTVHATDEYKKSMEDMSVEMVRYHLKDNATEEDIAAEAVEKFGLNTLSAQALAKAVVEHRAEYLARYFKWWYALVAVLVAFLASLMPLLVLMAGKKSAEAKRQEEVMQYQTLMLMLMYVPGTTVAVALEWMERFSSCFTETITEARVNLGSGSEDALLAMKDAEDYEPFRSFVDSLLAVDKSGMADAFDEVASDHEYYMNTKKLAKEAAVEDKAAVARMIQMIPLGGVLILYLIVPIVLYAADMLKVFEQATK